MEPVEQYWMAVSMIYAIASIYGTAYLLYRFAKPFMENKKGAFRSGITYFIIMLILYLVPVEINTFAAYSFGMLSAFTVMCRTDRRNHRQKLFLAATFFSLCWLSDCMARMLTEALYTFDTFKAPVTQFLAFSGIELKDENTKDAKEKASEKNASDADTQNQHVNPQSGTAVSNNLAAAGTALQPPVPYTSVDIRA